MLDGLWSFAKRHQRKLIVTAGIAGGLYYSGKYLIQRVTDMQVGASKERASKENIRRRFEQNQRDCLFTIMSLLPELSEQVLREVDVERLIAELRSVHQPQKTTPVQNEEEDDDGDEEEEESPKRSKVEIWEEIKIQSFTRTLIAVYSESLLTMLVHIQLNMVGRSTYLDSIIGKFVNEDESSDNISLEGQYRSKLPATDEQNFLMLSWWFLNRGWRQLLAQITEAVNHQVGELSLKERVSHRELASLFSSIHLHLREAGMMESLTSILLPQGAEDIGDYLSSNRLTADQVFTPVFTRLLDQLRDIIESSDFAYVLNNSIDRLTNQLLEALQDSFPELPIPEVSNSQPLPPTVEGEEAPNLDAVVKEFEEFSTVPESRVVIVQLLPRIAREGHQILNGVPNNYLENVSASREVQALSAAVYTAQDAD